MIRRWSRPALAVAVGFGVAVAACSLLVPFDGQQCSSTTDCTTRGAAFADSVCTNHVCVAGSAPVTDGGGDADAGDAGPDPWYCLDLPSETLNPNFDIHITFKLFDAIQPIVTDGVNGGLDFTVDSYTAVPGILLQGCGSLDPECNIPATPVVISDDAGQASVTVPGSFNGFIDLHSPLGDDGGILDGSILPSKLYMGNLLGDAATFDPGVATLKIDELGLLAGALGVALNTDPNVKLGHAFFQAYDCFDRLAAGVSFRLVTDAGSVIQWYAGDNGDFPSVTQMLTGSQGTGGAVNIPSGGLTLTATLADSNRVLQTVNTLITPAGTTFVWIRPRTH